MGKCEHPLMERDDYDGSTPLKNMKREIFCQKYASNMFGNVVQAYLDAGYSKDNANNAYGMLLHQPIKRRVQYLRRMFLETIGMDALQIMKERISILNDKEAKPGDKLVALKDIERALGLESPTKVEQTGQVDLTDVALTPYQKYMKLKENMSDGPKA